MPINGVINREGQDIFLLYFSQKLLFLIDFFTYVV